MNPAVISLRPQIDRHRLRSLRESRGVSRGELAAAAGIAERTVASVELGEHAPMRATVAVLAAALGIDPDALTIPRKDDDPALDGGEVVRKRRVSADDSE